MWETFDRWDCAQFLNDLRFVFQFIRNDVEGAFNLLVEISCFHLILVGMRELLKIDNDSLNPVEALFRFRNNSFNVLKNIVHPHFRTNLLNLLCCRLKRLSLLVWTNQVWKEPFQRSDIGGNVFDIFLKHLKITVDVSDRIVDFM